MMRSREKPALQVCRILLPLLLILGLLAPRAGAQNGNVGSSTEALARVAQLRNDV
jgi:hypothetical protein